MLFVNMRKVFFFFLAGVMSVGCASRYTMTGIERTRILVDERYDVQPNADALMFIAPYQRQVDSIMRPVVGHIAKYMAVQKPESALSNLLADILVWGARPFGEQPDFAVYNMGGIRAAFAEGEVTYGNVLDVAPFDNKICFLTLTGEKVLELFRQIAQRGGEGVSRGVALRIGPEGSLLSAMLNGQLIDEKKEYRVSTLDYLAQGNDGLEAFKAGTDIFSPQMEENNIRFVIMDYFRAETAAGRTVDAETEGRVVMDGDARDIPIGN